MSAITRHLMKKALDTLPSIQHEGKKYIRIIDVLKVINLADDQDKLVHLIQDSQCERSDK